MDTTNDTNDQSGAGARALVPLRVAVSVERGTVRVEGFAMAVPAGKTLHATAVHAAAVLARRDGQPRWCIAEDEAGRVRFLVHPDGHSSDVAVLSSAQGPVGERA